jgi:hypothetical protein
MSYLDIIKSKKTDVTQKIIVNNKPNDTLIEAFARCDNNRFFVLAQNKYSFTSFVRKKINIPMDYQNENILLHILHEIFDNVRSGGKIEHEIGEDLVCSYQELNWNIANLKTTFKKIMMVANHQKFERCIKYCNEHMRRVETFHPAIYYSGNPNDYDEWCSQ